MAKNLELYVDDIEGFLFAAVVQDKKLIDLYASPPNVVGSWASIHLGKVVKVDKNLDAAFVDIGNGLTGYLPAKYASIRKHGYETPRSGISKMVSPGQMLLAQIKVEGKNNSLYADHKLPRLTVNLHVPGGFLVYSPHADDINFSSSIDERHIEKLETKINLDGGWKVYPSARKLDNKDIDLEARYLKKHWKEIGARAKKMGDTPGLVEVGPIALFRALLDYGVLSYDHIYVGNKVILNLMLEWCAKHMPDLAKSKRLRLFKSQNPNQKLFDVHDLYAEIDKLRAPVVDLPSGANMVVETTSALTTVDVNQASCENMHKANLSAAQEVCRQIKVRNLSGIILVDFAGNPAKGERYEIIDILERHLATDIGSTQVHGFTRLGIVELTRRRRTAALGERFT